MTSTTPSADEVRALPHHDAAQRAVMALTGGQETFTRTQVAYLMALAFQVGADAAEQPDNPTLWNLAYRTGYAHGEDHGYHGALAEVWEDLRYAFSGPRREPANGIRGNLTAADAVWWHIRALDQRDARRKANDLARQPRDDDYRGGPVDWETGRPVRHLGAVA